VAIWGAVQRWAQVGVQWGAPGAPRTCSCRRRSCGARDDMREAGYHSCWREIRGVEAASRVTSKRYAEKSSPVRSGKQVLAGICREAAVTRWVGCDGASR